MALIFEVTLLGVNSAVPVYGRHPSCQMVRYDDRLLMIDCGEGSQQQLSRYHIKRSKISDVFISHMHGDHCFGLPGFLTTESLQRRLSPLTIHGPVGIKKYIDTTLEVSGSFVSYELHIIEYDTSVPNKIRLSEALSVQTFPLRHRIPTMGFLVKETKQHRNILPEKIAEHALTIEEIKSIKAGKDLKRGEVLIANTLLTRAVPPLRGYAYVSDTRLDMQVADYAAGATTMYHETTYLDDMEDLAAERMHTTIGGAVQVALKAGCQQMITGHYSSRYKDIRVFEIAGKALWSGVELGEEGRTYQV